MPPSNNFSDFFGKNNKFYDFKEDYQSNLIFKAFGFSKQLEKKYRPQMLNNY